jgi:hypothetical protein
MATINLRATQESVVHSGSRQAFKIRNVVDCGANPLDFDASDVAPILDVKAGWLVLRVHWKVTTEEGATLTFDIGDGSAADGFIDGADGNTAAEGVSGLALTDGSPNTVTGYSNGKFYTADDTIDFTPKNDADTAVIEVTAYVINFNDPA